MIRALDLLPIESSAGERHAAVRAGIAQSKGVGFCVSSDHEGLLQQHGLGQFSAAQLIRWQRAVPEAEEHERVGHLGLEWNVVRHWFVEYRTGENTAAAAKSKPCTQCSGVSERRFQPARIYGRSTAPK